MAFQRAPWTTVKQRVAGGVAAVAGTALTFRHWYPQEVEYNESKDRLSVAPGSLEVKQMLWDAQVYSTLSGNEHLLGEYWDPRRSTSAHLQKNPPPVLSAEAKTNSSTTGMGSGPGERFDLTAKAIDSGSMNDGGPIVLCFFRRFTCGVCQMSAYDISRAVMPDLARHGGHLVGVGIGRHGLTDFKYENYFVDGDIYLDYDKAIYELMQFSTATHRTLWGLVDPEIWRQSLRARRRDFRKSDFKGEMEHWGGTFVLAGANSETPGKVLYGHYQTNEDFMPDVAKIKQVLDEYYESERARLKVFRVREKLEKKEREPLVHEKAGQY